jgi:murein L,D-transpeptidase YcbB/YkuD
VEKRPKLWRNVRAPISALMIAAAALAFAPLPAAADPPAPSPTAAAPVALAATPATLTPFTGDVEIEDRLDGAGHVVIAGERLHDHLVRRFYAAHGWNRVWDAHPAAAAALWAEVLRADAHGLDPALLSDAVLGYTDALARGAVPVGERPVDEALQPGPVDIVAKIDAAISAPDPVPLIEALAPNSPDYLAMRRAYANYLAVAAAARGISVPTSYGLAPHLDRAEALRRARQVAINLERLRWLPREIPPDRLVVDTAAEELQLFRADVPIFTTRVVVGETDKQTPELRSVVKDVLFNPPWNIPPSIVRKEILPKLAANRGYLAQHHMRWRGPMSIQQEAGPYSALGRLKFEMDDPFDVYLHDTPEKWRFDASERRMSHGCVRVQNPRELAALLLGQNLAAIDGAIDVNRTHSRALPKPLPVFIVYRTAIVESDGTIALRGDPYDRDPGLWASLDRAREARVAQKTIVRSADKASFANRRSTTGQKTATIGD